MRDVHLKDYKFLILVTYHMDALVSKDVRIRGCSLAPEGVYEQKFLGNTVLTVLYWPIPSPSLR
jgi:hypothetical protein